MKIRKALRVFLVHGWWEALIVLADAPIRDEYHKAMRAAYLQGYREGCNAHFQARMEIEHQFTEEHLLQ